MSPLSKIGNSRCFRFRAPVPECRLPDGRLYKNRTCILTCLIVAGPNKPDYLCRVRVHDLADLLTARISALLWNLAQRDASLSGTRTRW